MVSESILFYKEKQWGNIDRKMGYNTTREGYYCDSDLKVLIPGCRGDMMQ